MTQSIKTKIRASRLAPVAVKLRNVLVRLFAYPKWRSLKNKEIIWLEFGSGHKKGTGGWTTVDLVGADISCDLRKGIPLPDESVDRIYSSHMFEHIPYQELVFFINECFRVLKKGGELSVCVPNAGLYIQAYIAGSWFRPIETCHKPAVVDTGSFLDQVNYIAYMGQEHRYMFDEENLINTLKMAAFRDVALREFDASIDLETRHFESIYAVAVK